MTKKQNFSLGTANLGMSYGVTNNSSFDPHHSRGILTKAINYGIRTFDTAPDYGIAEELLGELATEINPIKVVTKIPKMDTYSIENVYSSLQESARKLRTNSFFGVLFHDSFAHKKPNLDFISNQLLETGITTRIGFSAYSHEELIEGKNRNSHWNFFQIPENIADRRSMNSGDLELMSHNGDLLQIRSAFLQGLLLANPDDLATQFAEIRNISLVLREISEDCGVSVLDLCLSYTNKISWSSGTIVGAAREEQIESIIKYKNIDIDLEKVPTLSPQYLDPRNWQTSS